MNIKGHQRHLCPQWLAHQRQHQFQHHEGRHMDRTVTKIVSSLALLLCSFGAQAAPDWKCEFKDVRAGRVGTVLWAYCFGIEGDQVRTKKRVILGQGVTPEMEADAMTWARTGTPELFARPANEAIWNSAEAQPAIQAMRSAISAEFAAGTAPKAPQWRVAKNARSTTVPPTRPMWNPAGTKEVSERAYVDDLCNCSAPLARGAQTLCPLRQLGDLVPTANRAACELK